MNRRSVCLRNRIPWLSQFLRMMKIALVFVFLSVSSLFASVNAQRVRIEKCLVAGNLRTGEKTDRNEFYVQ